MVFLKNHYSNDYLVENILRKNVNKVFLQLLEFKNTHNNWIKASDLKK